MRITEGFHSYCQIRAERVYKQYDEYALALGLLKNEIKWYQRFANWQGTTPRAPRLLDYTRNTLIMEYCGEPITKTTLPDNFKDQLRQIAVFLQANHCLHCDIMPNNLLVKKNRIYLIDFGWAIKLGQDPYQKWSNADRIILDCMNVPYRAPDWPNDKYSLEMIYHEYSGKNKPLFWN